MKGHRIWTHTTQIYKPFWGHKLFHIGTPLMNISEDEQDLAVTNVGDNDLLVKTALDRRGNNRDNNYTNNDLTDTLVDATLPLMKMTFTSMTIMQTNLLIEEHVDNTAAVVRRKRRIVEKGKNKKKRGKIKQR